MKHLGDITKISGYGVPVVDCVIGGSPCQDLSQAGLRKGLGGARSGLYIDQIRIIREMREYDQRMGRSGVDVRPRYMVWENVPGAFSTTEVKTSQQSLKKQSVSQSRKLPLCLCLKKDGQQADSSTMRWESGLSHGGCWMPSIGEFRNAEGAFVSLLTSTDSTLQRLYLENLNTTEAPSEVVETHLSDILESDPDPKYNLSPKACRGIMNRANRRGKKLPEMLETALVEQSVAISTTDL